MRAHGSKAIGTKLRERIAGVLGRALGKVAGRARVARVERFGAIIQLTAPRALVFVDREKARRLGVTPPAGSELWSDASADGEVGAGVLSAPLEAHLQITNRCGAGCRGCYTGATTHGAGDREWGLLEWKRALDELARMGVFHVALGGGESAVLPWLGELAEHARGLGVVPNLTTSGLEGLDELVSIAGLFGQINVSMDGLGATYAAVRGFDGFARADRAVRALRAVKREIGINVVVTRHNFAELDGLVGYARDRALCEVELLRFKPAGRGVREFSAITCTDAQHRRFLPVVLDACRRHRIRVRVDCSYTPMIAHHDPGPELLGKLAVYGCTAGDFLVAARATGVATGCSFAQPVGASGSSDKAMIHELGSYWPRADGFMPYRGWRDAVEPCRSCHYFALCRGGCKVVSAHVLGDGRLPDPECPRVIDQKGKTGAFGGRARLPVVM